MDTNESNPSPPPSPRSAGGPTRSTARAGKTLETLWRCLQTGPLRLRPAALRCAAMLALGLLMSFAAPASARTIYVSKLLGGNQNNGSSPALAVATVGYAYQIAVNGDVISIDADDYRERFISPNVLTKRVTFQTRNGTSYVGDCPYPGLQVGLDGRRFQINICRPSASAPSPGAILPLTVSPYNQCAEPLSAADVQVNWSQVSGPDAMLIVPATALATTAVFTQPGIYELKATVTRGRVSISPLMQVTVVEKICDPNPPVGTDSCTTFMASAGADQDATTAQPVLLAGKAFCGSTEYRPDQVSAEWKIIAPNPVPGAVTFDSLSILSPTFRFSVAGDYDLQLTTKELSGQRRTAVPDVVRVRVTTAPVVDPGCYLVIASPHSGTLELPAVGGSVCETLVPDVKWNGSITLPAGTTVQWTRVAGPDAVTFDNATAKQPRVCFTAPSQDYQLKLVVTSGTCRREMIWKRTVNQSCPNLVAGAGADGVLLLDPGFLNQGKVCATLNGTVTGAGGAASTVTWEPGRESPSGVTFNNRNILSPEVCFNRVGVYRLHVTAKVGTDCEATDDVVYKVGYVASRYITGSIKPNCNCCGTEWILRNTHPTCAIRAVVQPLGGARCGNSLPAQTVTLQPNGTFSLITGGQYQLVSAQYLCPPEQAVAGTLSQPTLFVPPPSQGQLAQGVMRMLLDIAPGEPYRVECSRDLVTWSVLATGNGGDYPLWISDPGAGQHSQCFYRVVNP